MASEQDEVNTVLWLATWAGKMGPLHLLSITGIGPQKSYRFDRTINPILASLLSRWLDIGLILFCVLIIIYLKVNY